MIARHGEMIAFLGVDVPHPYSFTTHPAAAAAVRLLRPVRARVLLAVLAHALATGSWWHVPRIVEKVKAPGSSACADGRVLRQLRRHPPRASAQAGRQHQQPHHPASGHAVRCSVSHGASLRSLSSEPAGANVISARGGRRGEDNGPCPSDAVEMAARRPRTSHDQGRLENAMRSSQALVLLAGAGLPHSFLRGVNRPFSFR